MPHLRIDYSANLVQPPSWPVLFAELHAVLEQVAGVELANCKSRAYAAEHFLVGDPAGSPNEAFVHLDLRLLEGRAPELLEQVGREALACLERACHAASAAQPLQLTVSIDELKRPCYFKNDPRPR